MEQAPFAVSSLDPMAQGHPVLPPYGSGLGRERAVFPRYYRSRPPSKQPAKVATDCQLQERAVRLRHSGAQPFVGSQPSSSLYELIAAVAWIGRSQATRGAQDLIVGCLSLGGYATNGAESRVSV